MTPIALLGALWFASLSLHADEPSPTPQGDAAGQATLFLVGDSTVKNGSGKGDRGQWGWGQVLQERFDAERLTVENRALGGRSSRTYLTEGLWQRTLQRIKPGDFVLIQFGHNDGGKHFEGDRPRASLKGNGDETIEGVVEVTGQHEVVQSFGWYLRRYVADAQAKGATPIVLSLVPRDIWRDGKVIRADDSYGKWAADAARDAGAFFIDLNEIVAQRYEQVGQEKVHKEYFTPADHTHTSRAGAEVNADCVAAGIRRIEECRLKEFLKSRAESDTPDAASLRFDFGPGAVAEGYQQVTAEQVYSAERGFGFESGGAGENLATGDDPLSGDGCTSASPFYFSAKLPEGNYRVRVTSMEAAGDPLTIKAELRRLMVAESSARRHEFLVNVRTPTLKDGRQVRLKPRERETEQGAWDDRLTLEFNGPRPAISSLTITPAPNATTVFLLGDSTVADQPREPWNSWGQMLPRFFGAEVVVANHSESGETIAGSLAAGRFDKIFEQIKRGDFLFIQFGHNDMKNRTPDALANYTKYLGGIVQRTRQLGATPVLVTSMERKSGVREDTLAGYPQAVRDIATERGVALVDLNAASKRLYAALGADLDRAFVDGTHHNAYGSYQLARCVVAGIRTQLPDLASHLTEEVPPIDVDHPDPVDQWRLPASPIVDRAAPEGS